MSSQYISVGAIQVSNKLYQFIDQELSVGLDINADGFFSSLSEILTDMQGENIRLLNVRNTLEKKINQWHLANKDSFDATRYKQFLIDIGYLLPESDDFSIEVSGVDDEIAKIAGPQLVVPVSNARFSLNAVNARWGSLYDGIYGSNIIKNSGVTKITNSYNPQRGNAVISWVNSFLDPILTLSKGSYAELSSIEVVNHKPIFNLKNNTKTTLKNQDLFAGYKQTKSVLFRHNNLHIELVLDEGKIKDVILESAITTIIDFEDSVATVSDDEKICAYRNFFGLMKGDLTADFSKNGKTLSRQINPDKTYTAPDGTSFTLSATSLMLVRNVGHHMLTDLVKNEKGESIPEGILDAMVTTLCAMHDLQHLAKNSKTASMYIVKPKMHGVEEVAFTSELFSRVETALGLANNTLKMGIMDEERRTSVNLKACIKAAKNRVIFINTGFLDRTGDEIHTSMLAGVFLPKQKIKQAPWINAYEKLNVKTGLECGFYQNAQIGKGMWAEPDRMSQMLNTKITHLQAGANCAWVPSPTAATLHATHYHQLNVFARQKTLLAENASIKIDELLRIPLLKDKKLSNKDIQNELENNAQGILGYVVRWIDQGVGCSKVQDINHIGLMEDRATLRISSQHMANWLAHKVCSEHDITRAFEKMAVLVDAQNKDDPDYKNLAPKFNGYAYQAALALVFEGQDQPNGYTEYILTKYRKKALAL